MHPSGRGAGTSNFRQRNLYKLGKKGYLRLALAKPFDASRRDAGDLVSIYNEISAYSFTRDEANAGALASPPSRRPRRVFFSPLTRAGPRRRRFLRTFSTRRRASRASLGSPPPRTYPRSGATRPDPPRPRRGAARRRRRRGGSWWTWTCAGRRRRRRRAPPRRPRASAPVDDPSAGSSAAAASPGAPAPRRDRDERTREPEEPPTEPPRVEYRARTATLARTTAATGNATRVSTRSKNGVFSFGFSARALGATVPSTSSGGSSRTTSSEPSRVSIVGGPDSTATPGAPPPSPGRSSGPPAAAAAAAEVQNPERVAFENLHDALERRGIVPRVQRREQTRVVERRVRPGAAPSPPKEGPSRRESAR